jgi:RHS repeat-associated protein
VAKDASGNTTTKQYEVSVTGSTKTFAYDANGNLTGDGSRTFEWDARNQLVAVEAGTLRSEFAYYATRQRAGAVEKQSGTTVRSSQLVWCEAKVCDERESGAVVLRAFTNGEQGSGQPRFFAPDHVGTVRDLTDGSSSLVARYEFDPWGRRTQVSGSGSTVVGFTGHRVNETGAIFMALYRSYDPSIGRWLSQDPVGLAEGPNLFLYAKNKAVIGFDPFGDQECQRSERSCSIAVKGREIDMWIRFVPGVPLHYFAEITVNGATSIVEAGPGQNGNVYFSENPPSEGTLVWSEVPTQCSKVDCLKSAAGDTGRKYVPLKNDSGDNLDQLLKKCGYPGESGGVSDGTPGAFFVEMCAVCA